MAPGLRNWRQTWHASGQATPQKTQSGVWNNHQHVLY
jgi:hypothetical protein